MSHYLIALKERINEKKALISNLSFKEEQCALRIRSLIESQALAQKELYDLEKEYERMMKPIEQDRWYHRHFGR